MLRLPLRRERSGGRLPRGEWQLRRQRRQRLHRFVDVPRRRRDETSRFARCRRVVLSETPGPDSRNLGRRSSRSVFEHFPASDFRNDRASDGDSADGGQDSNRRTPLDRDRNGDRSSPVLVARPPGVVVVVFVVVVVDRDQELDDVAHRSGQELQARKNLSSYFKVS